MMRRHRTKRHKKYNKGYRIAALVATLAVILQALYPIIPFLPSFGIFKKNVIFANDNILATGDTEKIMFANTNPEFKVEFGNKEQADKPFVRFQALGSKENPFAKNKNVEIKETFFERLQNAIYGEKEHGIEFSMESAETDIIGQSTVGSGQSGYPSALDDSGTSPLKGENKNSSPPYKGRAPSEVSQLGGEVSKDNQVSNSNSNQNDNELRKASVGSSGNSIGTLVQNGNKVSPMSTNNTAQGNTSEENSGLEPRAMSQEQTASDQSALELQAELQAEEEIYKMLNDQLDALIKGETTDKKAMTDQEIEEYRAKLKQQILNQLTREQGVKTTTQTAKIEDPEDKTRQKDIVKNTEVVPGVDMDYRIMEEKGLKEEIVVKSNSSFTKECIFSPSSEGESPQGEGVENSQCSLPKNVYTFSLNLDPGVVMHHAIGATNQKPHGITYFTDEKGKYLFHFLPLYAEDASGVRTNAVKLEISDNSETSSYTMKVVVDLGWLLDPERQFPVRIDPSIVHDTEVEFDAGNSLIRLESLSDPKVDIKAEPIEFGNGADGACTVSSGTTDINSSTCAGRGSADAVNYSVTANTTSGQNQVTTSATPTGIAAGDEVLIINLMGTNTNYSSVGRYETKTVTAVNSSTLTLNANLKYAYDGTTQKIMVQRVPHYTSVTVSSGATLTASAWNGTKNGVLFFRATGTVTNSGTIDMNQKGFRGGGNDTSGPEGYSGRSASGGGTGGAGGTGSRVDSDGCGGYVCGAQATNGGNGTNNSGGGGGGGDDGSYCTQGSGGSGGSRGGGGGGGLLSGGGGSTNGTAGAGSTGLGSTTQSGGGGGGGASYSALANSSDLSSDKIMLGGGAAAGAAGGSAGSAGAQGAGGAGGAPYSSNTGNPGGGIIYISGFTVTLSGTVSVNGGNGGAGTSGAAGSNGSGSGGGGSGGGGASGGSIIVKGNSVSLGTVTGSGGSGGSAGSGGNGDDEGGDGGAGSAGSSGSSGVTGVYYHSNISGTMTPAPSVSRQVDFGYKYGDYTSSVLDLASVSTIDSLEWTEHGVASGDGGTPYSSTGLVSQWNFNETSGTTAANNAGAGSCGGTATDCDFTLNNFASTGSQDSAAMSGWTADNLRWGAGAIMLSGTATADSLSRADIAGNVLDPNSLDMALSAWIKTNDTSAEIFSNNNANGTSCTNNGYYLGIDSNGYPVFNLDTNGATAGCDASITGIAKINDGGYHHLVATVTRGTGAYIYLDGTLVGSDTSVTSYSDITVTGTIYSGGSSGGFDGVLDAMKFYSRALGANEILSEAQPGNIEFQTRTGTDNSPDDGSWEAWRPTTSEAAVAAMDSDVSNWSWDSTATYMPQAKSNESNIKVEGSGSMKQIIGAPQADANTVGLWHMDETGGSGAYIKDISGNNNNGTPTGTTLADGISGKARSFSSGDDISLGNISMVDNLSNVTVEAWVNINDIASNTHRLFSEELVFFVGQFGGQLQFGMGNGSAWSHSSATMGAIPLNQWAHIALVKSGTNVYGYVNGQQTATSAGPSSLGTSSNTNYISTWDGTNQTWGGSADEIRISNTARSAEEIAEAYRMGRDHRLSRTISSNDLSDNTKLPFWVAGDRVGTYLEAMVGESAYANGETDANTVGLWHLEEQSGSGAYIKDSSSVGNHGTPTGTTFTDGRIGKAKLFDDSDDYINIGDNAALDLSTNGTVEAWIKPNANEADNWFVCKNGNYCLGVNASGAFLFTGASAQDDGGTTLLAGKWYHVAVTNDNTTATYYIDGAKVATDSVAWGATLTNDLRIGRDGGSNYFDGLIDEVRISNSVRSAVEIRQAFEAGKRTHPITIDFQAKLDSGNLITGSGDTSFTVDARPYLPTTNYGENLYIGDKVIVKENYDGTEYIAQGTVTAIAASSGATTVAAWDTGSTFPGSGYTANASVFKWQKEWMDLTAPISSQIDAVTNLTLRCTDGSEGRTVYLDDFKSGGPYLTTADATGNVTSTAQRYMQYRAIFSTTDSAVTPYLSGVTVNYTQGPTTDQLMRHGRWFSSNVIQPFWWAR